MSELAFGNGRQRQIHFQRRRKRRGDGFDRHQMDAVLNLSLGKLPGHILLPATSCALNQLLALVGPNGMSVMKANGMPMAAWAYGGTAAL